jgi:hypothetical protein
VPNALLEALGGIAPPPVNPKDPVFAEARRWVCLVALLPIAQQKAEYDRQFAYAIEHGKYDTDPIYCAVRLVRYTVIPGSSEFDPKETLDLSFKDQFQRDQKEQKLWVMIAPEVVPPRYVRIDTANLYDDQRKIGMGVITQPLAPLMLQRWESWATHPQLVQIPVVETKEEAPAEPVAPEPAPEAAPPPMGQPVQDAFGNPIAPAPAPAAARPAAAPRRVVARSRPKESENVEYQLVRIFDFSVQPGVQYRYKLQLMLRNPNFEMAPMNLQDPKVATSKLLNSPFSELSNVVAVPQGQSVLADTVVRPEPPAAPAAPMGGRPPAAPLDSMASVVVKILNFDAAQLTFAALNLRRGAMVAGNAAQIIVDPIARTVARSDKSEVKTDLVLADFHGGEPLDEGLEAPAEVLFIDAAGQLVVQNSVNDELWVTAVREFKGLLDAVEAANQPAAGNAAAVGTGGDVNALHKAADPARGPAKGGAKGGGKPPKTPKDMNK